MNTQNLFPCFDRVARFVPVSTADDTELWDVFLRIGSYEVGSRVAVHRTAPRTLEWESVRGARNRARLTVTPVDDGLAQSRVTVVLRFHLEGLLLARLATTMARGIVTRLVEAGLERLRHRLEYGE